MARLSITDEIFDTEIDLWGHIFTVVKYTKKTGSAISRELAEINKEIDATTEDQGPDRLLELLGRKYDVLLRPVGGGKKKASKLLKEKWDAEEIDLPAATRFLAEVEAQQIRPT